MQQKTNVYKNNLETMGTKVYTNSCNNDISEEQQGDSKDEQNTPDGLYESEIKNKIYLKNTSTIDERLFSIHGYQK